jgi:hypothetical protein
LKIVSLDLSANRKFIVGDKSQQQPLFDVIFDFEGSQINFMPGRFDVRDAIKNSITAGVDSVCRYDLFISQPEFEVYMNA